MAKDLTVYKAAKPATRREKRQKISGLIAFIKIEIQEVCGPRVRFNCSKQAAPPSGRRMGNTAELDTGYRLIEYKEQVEPRVLVCSLLRAPSHKMYDRRIRMDYWSMYQITNRTKISNHE